MIDSKWLAIAFHYLLTHANSTTAMVKYKRCLGYNLLPVGTKATLMRVSKVIESCPFVRVAENVISFAYCHKRRCRLGIPPRVLIRMVLQSQLAEGLAYFTLACLPGNM